MPDFELSSYQKEILKFFKENPHENMLVRALAGTGKSSTICILTENSSSYDVYLAFNNSIAQEFRERIKNPKTKVYTLHALGLAIMNHNIKKIHDENRKGFGKNKIEYSEAKLDNFKITRINEDLYDMWYGKYEDFGHKLFITNNFSNLYNLIRCTYTNPYRKDSVKKLINDYNLFIDFSGEDYTAPTLQECMSWIKELDERSLNYFEETGRIDFGDMLYITYNKIKDQEWEVPYWAKFTNIYNDESQDYNNLFIRFIKWIKRPGGRYIFVQDKNQAIYNFNGANAHAYEEIIEEFKPKIFDLPINYRCAKSHLSLVNKKFGIPIQPRPDAPDGEVVEEVDKKKIKDLVHPGDFIISRKNKWLSEVTVDLIKAGIPVYIEDKELLNEIEKIVASHKNNKLSSLSKRIENNISSYYLKIALVTHGNELVDEDEEGTDDKNIKEKLNKNEEVKAELNQSETTQTETFISANSKIDNLSFLNNLLDLYIEENPKGNTVGFRDWIHKMLSQKSKESVRLCSVHKAKGLEAPNVFVLNEGKICKDIRNSAEQNQQERNLSYISFTRAKNKLYLVKEPNADETPKSKSGGMDNNKK